MSTTWREVLAALVAGQDLSAGQAAWAMGEIMAGQAAEAQVAGFLVGLRAKGETVAELGALAQTMLDHAVRIDVPGRAVDVVGSGGDGYDILNFSTMASIVAAGAGLTVVKHGNRAASSACGSADVLEALGVRLDVPAEQVARVATEVGITFCFAQVFHPSMRHAGPARRALGVRTSFNFLGPLTNPARPAASAVGISDARMAELVVGVLAARGSGALVFHGTEGVDKLTTTAPVRVWVVEGAQGTGAPGGAVAEYTLDLAEVLDLPRRTLADLRGAGADHNAQVVREMLTGAPGPVRETALLNAAAALVADGTVPGTGDGTIAERLVAGYRHAADAVDSGAAAAVLDRWRAATA